MDIFPSFVTVSQLLLMSNSTRINCTDCGKIWIVHGQEEIHQEVQEIIKKFVRKSLISMTERIFREIFHRD